MKIELEKTDKGFTGFTQLIEFLSKNYDITWPDAFHLLCNCCFDSDVIEKVLIRAQEIFEENLRKKWENE